MKIEYLPYVQKHGLKDKTIIWFESRGTKGKKLWILIDETQEMIALEYLRGNIWIFRKNIDDDVGYWERS